MTFTGSEEDLFAVLRGYDTPTICNGLEAINPGYRASGYTRRRFAVLAPDLPPVLGYARTATIRSAMPPAGDPARKRVDYYTYVSAPTEQPRVVVIQDLDAEAAVGAFWGEVNTNIHKALGVAGCVTNGSFRDLDDSADGFQLLGGQVGPSHAYVHVDGFGAPVDVHGMQVAHDDLVHADKHGAVRFSLDEARQLPDAIAEIAAREKITLDACKAPDFSIDRLREILLGPKDVH